MRHLFPPRIRLQQGIGGQFTLRLLGALGLCLAGGLALLYNEYQERVIAERAHHLMDFEQGMVSSLQTLMRSGQAHHVREWLAEARDHPGLQRVQILRPDGRVAFRDLTTLRQVNAFLGEQAFQRPPRPPQRARKVDDGLLARALEGRKASAVDWTAGHMTHLIPLRKEAACERCHGYTDREVLGAVRLTADLSPSQERIWTALGQLLGYTGAVLIAMGLLTVLLVHRQILRPLRAIRRVVTRWGAGELAARAPEERRDELGDLARALNWMAGRLERTIDEIRDLITRSATGMMVVDREGTILFSNPAAQHLMNRTAEQLKGVPLGIPLVSGEKTEIEVHRPQGDTGTAELSVQPTEWDGGTAYLVTFHDVTERHRAEEAARFQAIHDDLTGLPNRTHFHKRLEEAITRAGIQETGLAVIFLDLDRFKEINDSLGHAAGDELLRQFGHRLREAVRDTDTVARLSGDEFTVLLEGIGDRETALKVAEKLRDSLFRPLTVQGESLTPAGTLGVSLFPQDGTDAETLLMRADTAMYNAKEAGRNQIHTFEQAQGRTASRRFRLEQGLRRAQANGEFRVVYQPQATLPGGEPKGVEALLRWEDPAEGAVSPGEFIPLLEETGMIEAVGEQVFAQVLTDLAAWDTAGERVERVWVNIAARQLAGSDLVRRLDALLADSPIGPERLGIELTESSVAGDAQHAAEVLEALRQRGCAIAMDDFGKGYSALTFLRQLPFDVVKIDLAFIRTLPDDRENLALVRAIIAMGHGLGLKVLAEGVETREQVECLHAEGCDFIQGFYLARPLPADSVPTFLAEHGTLWAISDSLPG